MIRLRTVCIGHPITIHSKTGLTGHLKRPVAGPVQITTEGAAGDCIVDRGHHGGPDQALCLIERTASGFSEQWLDPVRFVPLRMGKQ